MRCGRGKGLVEVKNIKVVLKLGILGGVEWEWLVLAEVLRTGIENHGVNRVKR